MEPLNNDMDALFRDAGNNYPLKTDSGNFDAVFQQLQGGGGDDDFPPALPAAPKRQRWPWLLLLLLLLYPAYRMLTPHNNNSSATNNTNNNNTTATAAAQQKIADSTGGNTTNNNTSHTTSPPAADAAGNTGVNTGAPGNRQTAAAANSTTTREKNATAATVAAGYLKKSAHAAIHNGSGNDNTTGTVQRSHASGVPALSAGNAPLNAANTSNTNQLLFYHPDTAIVTSLVSLQNNTAHNLLPTGSALNLQGKDSAAPIIHPLKKAGYQKGFYLGLQVSGDISTVKMQQVQHPGYSAGILLGYRLSRRWAVESGILWTHKDYYSDGEYVKNSKVQEWWPGATVLNVNGWCNMIEIPATARYYFSVKENSSWYATGGLLAYFMQKESYNYLYQTGNYDPKQSGYIPYKNASKNLFTILQLGAGYERNVGVLGTLRIEPYLKLPLSGVGVDKLPLTSMGLNIGLTKSIGRK